MPKNIDARLTALWSRRSGIDRYMHVARDAMESIIAKSSLREAYQERVPDKPYTRYALGAMQEVDPEYTAISLRTADRVKVQLEAYLTRNGRRVAFELQGSVPCNIHIRGVSDVDLLTLDTAFVTFDSGGHWARGGSYSPYGGGTPVEELQSLRGLIKDCLVACYPEADIDNNGSKAVKISGGSLQRPVDVVPSHWHDTAEYQVSGRFAERGVKILDTSVPTTHLNKPFKHIELVTAQDDRALGGLKKAVRLCKNVKSDAEADINLSSFDITAAMYHARLSRLQVGYLNELAILVEAQRHLDELYRSPSLRQTLRVPDGSRLIFDQESKVAALLYLSVELDDLLRQVAREQSPILSLEETPSFDRCYAALQPS